MHLAAETFRWTEAYRVNVLVLDEQHKQLIRTVNELDRALRVGEGNSVLDGVLQKLVDYSLEHFATEEKLMQEHDFPGLSTHQSQHDEFRKKLAGFLEGQRAGKPGVPVSLLLFMRGWLKDHLIKTDRQYSAYLNAHGVY